MAVVTFDIECSECIMQYHEMYAVCTTTAINSYVYTLYTIQPQIRFIGCTVNKHHQTLLLFVGYLKKIKFNLAGTDAH